MPESEEVKENAPATNLRSVFSVGLLTTLSRILGLVRESTKAHFLGTQIAADAFQMAFMIPSALRSLVAEGAVSSAIVPVFTRYARGDDRAEMRLVAEKYLTFWLGLVLVVTIAGVLVSGHVLVLLFEHGMIVEKATVDLTVDLVRVLFWYLPLVGLAAALQGILHAHGRFTVSALAPAMFNFVFVATAWCVAPFLAPGREVWAFAAAVLAGGSIQFSILVPFVWKLGIRPRLRRPFDHRGVREMLRLLVPATFGSGIYQINVVVNLLLASRLASGYVSALGYSSRVMEVVLGVFVFALNTVSLTALSRQAADKDWKSYSSTVEEVLRLALFITIPSAIGLFVLREEIIAILFRSGQFDAESQRLTATAFQFHVLGLVFVGASRGLVSGFYALKDVRTPVRVAALNLFVNLGLAWWLSAGPLGFAGIALASSLSAILQMTLLAILLRRKVEGLRFTPVFATAAKASIAAAIMGSAVWGGSLLLEVGGSRWLLGGGLALVIGGGAAVYFAVARGLRMGEASRLLRALRRRS
jgi:putative peptidoglycan lipid II flippase